MRVMKRVLTVGVVVVVAACGRSDADGAGGFRTAVVERGSLRVTVEATGAVEPIRRVEVKSRAGGEVVRLHADVGDHVAPGTLLAEIDPRDVRNLHGQVAADLEVAQARARIARSQLERSQELHDAGVITDQELDGATLEDANAQATLVKARTSMELAALQLEDVTIRAPMSGTIISKGVEEGVVIQSASQNVSGGTTLFTMANLDEMQVRTLVDETDMGEIQSGMPARVTVEAFPDRRFEGTVEKVEPQAVVEQNVTMFPVIVRLQNRARLLKPGMNAEVEILIDEAVGVLLAPNNAIVLMQDVMPAAMALGLDPERIDMTEFRGAGHRAAGGGGFGHGAGGHGAGASGAAASDDGGHGPPVDGADRRARLESLRAQVERGEVSRDSLAAVMQAMRGGAGGGVDGPGAGAEFGATDPGAAPPRQTRRAVVFVLDSAGVAAPKAVEIGLNDWDHTQIVSGVEEGEVLAVIGAALLQAQQQEVLNNFRNRRSGPFGGGGPVH